MLAVATAMLLGLGIFPMRSPLRFTPTVQSLFGALAVGAYLLALSVPKLSMALGVVGGLAIGGVWFRASLRTGRLAWWESGVAPLTKEEVVIGLAGALLYAMGFVALMAGKQQAI